MILNKSDEPVQSKMEALRLIVDAQVTMSQQTTDSFMASYRRSCELGENKARETNQNQVKLAKLKSDLREAEDEFVKVLTVKTRREAKQVATRDEIAAKKARIAELKRTVEVQRARRDEYAAVISQQSKELATREQEKKEDTGRKGEIQEAILWYNRVLGLHVEGGYGVKFTFNNVNMKNPREEYTFTVRHANDTYTLLGCEPSLNHIKELIQELNRTNDLFRFVRNMREEFEKAAFLGSASQASPLRQDTSTVCLSAPAISVSSDRSESPGNRSQSQVQLEVVSQLVNTANYRSESAFTENDRSKKVNYREAKQALRSPDSGSSLRRSTRIKVKK